MEACNWDNPGHNSYQHAPYQAVASYKDIPTSDRLALVEKMKAIKYDDIVVIGKNSLYSSLGNTLYINLRDMHFGKGSVCSKPSRKNWKEDAQEIALIYCSGEHCLAVPTVCRNVSRLTRVAEKPSVALPANEPEVQPSLHSRASPSYSIPSNGDSWGGNVHIANNNSVTNSFVYVSGVGVGYVIPMFVPVVVPAIISPINPIPEPSTYLLFGLGLLILMRKLK